MPLTNPPGFSALNPPPDYADPLELTAFNPFTRVYNPSGGFNSTGSAGFIRVLPSDARLTYKGAGEMGLGAAYPDTECYASRSLYPHNWNSQPDFSVDFFTDAIAFEFCVKFLTTSSAYRLSIDGRRVTDTAVLFNSGVSPAGDPQMFRFDFTTSKPRRITIDLYNAPFNGVYIPSTASLWKSNTARDRTLIIGDSITGGSTYNAGASMGTWAKRVALQLGWDDVWNQSIGGTGYVNAGAFVTFGARATGTVAGSTGGLNDVGQYGYPSGVTRVIIWGGYNDAALSQATISTNAGALYQNIKAAIPAAVVYVIGCFSPTGSVVANLTTTDETLRVAAQAAGLPFISPITGNIYNSRGTLLATQGPWITAANEDIYVNNTDNVHPNDAGHIYIARRIASALQVLSNAAIAVEPWAGGLHAAIDDGVPSNDKEWNFLNGPATLATLTPTALTVAAARAWSYNCQFPIVVNRLRWFGIGATAAIYRLAVYRLSDGVQVIGPISITTTADAWNSAAVPAVTLAANTAYIVALSATTTGTTAGFRTGGLPALYPPLQAASPGGLALAVGDHRFWFGQFAVTSGVLPATMPALVRGSGWTAGLPLFFFDSNSA